MKLNRPLRRYGLIAIGLLVVFTVVGFFALPPIARVQLEKRLSVALGRKVTVERVRLNPYALSLTLENLAISEQDQKERFLGWQRLYANFDALSSLRGEWVLSEVQLDGLTVRGVVNADGSLNVSDVLAKLTPPAESAPKQAAEPARPVRVERLQVNGAKIDFTDLSRSAPFTTAVGPLTFELTNFRTAGERGAPYRFEAVTEAGEKLRWAGTIRAQPFQSAGELSIENVVLSKYAPYYADQFRGEITAGRLSMRGHYEIALGGDRPVLVLSEGALELRDFALRERGADRASLELPSLDISGVKADAASVRATVSSIAVTGGRVAVRRDKDGALNLITLLQPTARPAAAASPAIVVASAPPAAAVPAPDVKIGEISVKDFDVEVDDLAAPRPAKLGVKAVQLALTDVTLADGAKIPLRLAFGWAPQGTVQLSGSVVLRPLAIDLATEVTGLSLLPLSPYLEEFANVHLTQGAISAKISTQASVPDGQPVIASVAGDITIEKLGLVDSMRDEEFVGFSGLTVTGLRASVGSEMAVSINELGVKGPYARVVVAQDKSVNLLAAAKSKSGPAPSPGAEAPAAAGASAIVPPATATPAPATTTPASTSGPKIDIGQIVISDGDFRFSDRSLTPVVNVSVSEFGGTISGLSSSNPTKGDVSLKGVVDGAGPVAITGKLDPLGAKTAVDLKVDVRNVDLLPLSPYTGKYAGYELARGKLVVDVKLLVDGKKIDAANVITLNQFTFGNAVQSPDATKLPVRLAVALLKDIEGRIVIDIPVQGNTDDPEFRIGRVVLRVIGNLLTKAAVSPFALLGSAFGGGGDELAYQEFAPGASELQPAEVKKLETMVKALTNRPGLNLDLEGGYDLAADAYALKRVKLTDRVRRAIWQARHDQNPNIPPPAELVIPPEEYAAMVKKLFDEAFPPGTQFGAPLAAAPVVAAPPPPPPGGFVKRMLKVITFSEQRAKHKAAAETARVTEEQKKAAVAPDSLALPLEEMTGRLAEATTVDDNDLQTLAQARAQRVREYFITVGNIPAERLFLAKASADAERRGKGPRVFLNLQ